MKAKSQTLFLVTTEDPNFNGFLYLLKINLKILFKLQSF